MKKNTLVSAFLICSLAFTACKSPTVSDEKSSTENFADLADEAGFSESHDEPNERTKVESGEMIQIPVSGQDSANTFQLISEESSNKYLLVIHEWWGLNEHIKGEAEILFEKLEDVNVIALDLYDGRVATTREKAQEYMQGADEKRIEAIIEGMINYLPKNAEIATIGWCFGGGWSLKTAIIAGDKTNACVMYYGMPIEDVEKLAGLNSDVLFIYGKKDQWINEEMASTFEKNMMKAGKELTVLGFDADHAFANPSSEKYKEAAAKEANNAALEYLKVNF